MYYLINLKWPLGLLIFLLAFSCDVKKARKNIDSQAVKREMEAREPKQVKPGEILAKAQETGQKIAGATQKTLAGQLKKTIQAEGIPAAIKYCNIAALPITDSLSELHNATIKRVSFQNRNPDNYPDSIESQILDAYHYNAENNQPMQDNVQQLRDGNYLLYTKPIVVNNALCLNCHGEVGKQVTPDTKALLQRLYPEDKATGYKIGDLRGMWSIKLPKKKIIQSL